MSAGTIVRVGRKRKKKPGPWAWRIMRLQAKLGLNDDAFAERLACSTHTLRAWRYNERKPGRAILRLVEQLEEESTQPPSR